MVGGRVRPYRRGMRARGLDARAYLSRIGYRGGTGRSAKTLGDLQEAHLLSVPFENLNIGRGVPIVLEPDLLDRKVVGRRRGGFCYELNGLFHLLLTSLGFRSAMVSARVYDPGREVYGPEFDHLALLVDVSGEWFLADVGFGAFAMRPLKMAAGAPLRDAGGTFRIDPSGDERYVVSRQADDGDAFAPQYEFSTVQRRLGDFAEMCRFHQESPDSHFTRQPVCSMATPAGRITLTPDRFIETSGGARSETPIAAPGEWRAILLRRFGISL